ncbi:hypothetical protein MSG28_010536 [Choristoneura fumiferana]|uniref:Uncharacterized protein n=1 Tax=Choristoneura fumiferana TaxID=7141 RepID=A0ACC0KL09_CHOFU|nr:hypothetical protein MSG28_010536 [Choristoneura fumiferana]
MLKLRLKARVIERRASPLARRPLKTRAKHRNCDGSSPRGSPTGAGAGAAAPIREEEEPPPRPELLFSSPSMPNISLGRPPAPPHKPHEPQFYKFHYEVFYRRWRRAVGGNPLWTTGNPDLDPDSAGLSPAKKPSCTDKDNWFSYDYNLTMCAPGQSLSAYWCLLFTLTIAWSGQVVVSVSLPPVCEAEAYLGPLGPAARGGKRPLGRTHSAPLPLGDPALQPPPPPPPRSRPAHTTTCATRYGRLEKPWWLSGFQGEGPGFEPGLASTAFGNLRAILHFYQENFVLTRAHDAAAAALREEEGEVIDLTARRGAPLPAAAPAPAPAAAPLARALSSPLVGARPPATGLAYDALMLKHGAGVASFPLGAGPAKLHVVYEIGSWQFAPQQRSTTTDSAYPSACSMHAIYRRSSGSLLMVQRDIHGIVDSGVSGASCGVIYSSRRHQ